MRKLLAVVVALGLSSIAAAAPPSEASIDTLLAATRAEALVNSMLATVDQTMRQSLASGVSGQPPTEQQQRVIDDTSAKLANAFREEMSWAYMRPLYVQLYQETFSQEEIDGLIVFYKSPAGVAYVEKMPAVMAKSMSLIRSRMGPLMEKVKAISQQAAEDIKATK